MIVALISTKNGSTHSILSPELTQGVPCRYYDCQFTISFCVSLIEFSRAN